MSKDFLRLFLRKRVSLMIVAICCSLTAFSQQTVTITGTVTDSIDNMPLQGVSVLLSGSETAAQTDQNGNFSIQAVSGSSLLFRYVGYKEKSVSIGSQTTINVGLSSVAEQLESVVVIGYGVQKKRDVTSAISSVKGEELQDRPVAGVTNLLQGKVSGLNITSDGGEPGGGSKVRIRGIGTLTNNDPLYVIDGIPVNSGFYNLNPNDVASVEVFKDAAAAAIYGSRAANGVVYVTTKKGQSGKTQINFDSYVGTSDLTNYYNMADAEEYYQLKTIQNGGIPSWVDLYNKGYDTDWADALLRKGSVQNYNLSLSGGNEKFKFFTAASYLDQKGVQKKSDYERLNVRFNSDYTLNKRVKISSQLNISNETRHSFNQLYNALIASPIAPIYKTQAEIDAMSREDRLYNQYFDVSEALNFGSNPVAALARSNGAGHWLGIFGNISANVEITEGLTFNSTFGIEDSRYDANSFTPKYALGSKERNDNTSASASFSKSFHWTWNNILQYNKTIADHSFGLMAGIITEQTDSRDLNGNKSKGLGNEEHLQVINAMSDLATVGGGRGSSAMESYIGRFNYNYADRYLLQATIRRDGTYRFAEENRWGNFPSVSFGWRLSNEEFFKSFQLNWLNDVKFRASWGQLGNEQISEYQYMSIIEGADKRGYTLGGVGGEGKQVIQGYGPTQVSNPALRWETTEATNLGFDASFLDNKFNFQFDWFNRETKDVLYKQNLPAYVGAPNAEGIENGSVFVNGGTIQNRGFDMELSYNDHIGDVGLTLSANFAHYKNVLKSLGGYSQAITVSDARVNEVVHMLPGDVVGGFYGYVVDGFYQTQAEVDASPEKGKKAPGDFRYRDLNDDNQINDADDRKVIGNPNPKFSYGFNIGLEYKGFDLSTFWQGVYGNDIYNLANLYLTGWSEGSDSWNYYEGYLANSWQKAGDNPTYPKVGRYYTNYINPNSASIEKGSYLRLKNVQVGYNLPKAFTSKIGLAGGVRVYVSGENILTITNYSGNDPEVGNGLTLNAGLGGRAGSPSYVSGIDYADQYPISKTYTVGINVKF